MRRSTTYIYTVCKLLLLFPMYSLPQRRCWWDRRKGSGLHGTYKELLLRLLSGWRVVATATECEWRSFYEVWYLWHYPDDMQNDGWGTGFWVMYRQIRFTDLWLCRDKVADEVETGGGAGRDSIGELSPWNIHWMAQWGFKEPFLNSKRPFYSSIRGWASSTSHESAARTLMRVIKGVL